MELYGYHSSRIEASPFCFFAPFSMRLDPRVVKNSSNIVDIVWNIALEHNNNFEEFFELNPIEPPVPHPVHSFVYEDQPPIDYSVFVTPSTIDNNQITSGSQVPFTTS